MAHTFSSEVLCCNINVNRCAHHPTITSQHKFVVYSHLCPFFQIIEISDQDRFLSIRSVAIPQMRSLRGLFPIQRQRRAREGHSPRHTLAVGRLGQQMQRRQPPPGSISTHSKQHWGTSSLFAAFPDASGTRGGLHAAPCARALHAPGVLAPGVQL